MEVLTFAGPLSGTQREQHSANPIVNTLLQSQRLTARQVQRNTTLSRSAQVYRRGTFRQRQHRQYRRRVVRRRNHRGPLKCRKMEQMERAQEA